MPISDLSSLFIASAMSIVPMSQETFHHQIVSNDLVDAYDVDLPAGAVMRYHAHPTNHLAVVMTPGLLRNEVVGRHPVDRPTGPAGTIVYVPAGLPHRQSNIGPSPIRFIAIEVTPGRGGTSSPSGPEHAILAAPKPGCHLVVDKRDLKITRCLIGPGDSVTPPHAAGFLRVHIDAARKPAWMREATAVSNSSAAAILFVDVEVEVPGKAGASGQDRTLISPTSAHLDGILP